MRDQSLKRPSTSRVLCRRDQDARKDDCGDRHPRACRRHDSQHHRQTVPRHGMASNAATAEPFAREESFGFTAVDLRLVLRTLLRQHANLVSERLDLALQCFDLRLLLAHSRRHLLALLLNEALTPLRAALWALTSGRRGGGAALIFPPPPPRPPSLPAVARRGSQPPEVALGSAPFRCPFVAGLPRACGETLPPVAHFFWRCFRRTRAGDKVSDDPAALNAAGRFLPSGFWHSLKVKFTGLTQTLVQL